MRHRLSDSRPPPRTAFKLHLRRSQCVSPPACDRFYSHPFCGHCSARRRSVRAKLSRETMEAAPTPSAPPVVVVAPSPKSPPKYPDLCGRRRVQLELQILNREIGFIEEELQSVEGIQPVSRCCKEVNEYVGTKPDPLMPIIKQRPKPCCLWRWLRSKACFNLSWICCFSGCMVEIEKPSCSCLQNCNCCECRVPCSQCCEDVTCRPCCSCSKIPCSCSKIPCSCIGTCCSCFKLPCICCKKCTCCSKIPCSCFSRSNEPCTCSGTCCGCPKALANCGETCGSCLKNCCTCTGTCCSCSKTPCTCTSNPWSCGGTCNCSKFSCSCSRACCSCSNLSCFRPQCRCLNVSSCIPRCRPSCSSRCCHQPCCCGWRPSCCTSCFPACCALPSLSCPEYSCGCIWSCTRCTEACHLPKCSKPCCVTGCLC